MNWDNIKVSHVMSSALQPRVRGTYIFDTSSKSPDFSVFNDVT